MKPKAIRLMAVSMFVVMGTWSLWPNSSSGQQQFPDSNRIPACGCYCGGPTPGYFVFREGNCAGILASDACGEYVSSLPDTEKKQICTYLKAKSKPTASCPIEKALAQACDEPPSNSNCDKPAPWFGGSSSGCKDVQETQITINQNTATVSMCGSEVLKHVSEHFSGDPLFSAAHTAAFKQSIPKRVCCDKFREAAKTGSPCDPRTDLDCDGIPNQKDIDRDFPAIDAYTRLQTAPIDPFPPNFNYFDPDFLPDATAHNSKGVGDCPCKWELIKGDLKCNGAVNDAGEKQHVYTATWRCPTTKAEVFTTRYAPSSAPCP